MFQKSINMAVAHLSKLQLHRLVVRSGSSSCWGRRLRHYLISDEQHIVDEWCLGQRHDVVVYWFWRPDAVSGQHPWPCNQDYLHHHWNCRRLWQPVCDHRPIPVHQSQRKGRSIFSTITFVFLRLYLYAYFVFISPSMHWGQKWILYDYL